MHIEFVSAVLRQNRKKFNYEIFINNFLDLKLLSAKILTTYNKKASKKYYFKYSYFIKICTYRQILTLKERMFNEINKYIT